MGNLPECNASWKSVPDSKVMTAVLSQVTRVNRYREMGLTGVMVVANWLIRRVIPLKEQSHPAWDYTGLDDSSCETSERLGEARLLALLGELFTDVTNWSLPDGVRVFNASVDHCAVRHSLLVILASLPVLTWFSFYRSCTGLSPPPPAMRKESLKKSQRERGTLARVCH